MQCLEFDEEEFRALVRQHNAAVREGKESFLFNTEYELVTSYSYYLIEYLSAKFLHIKITQNKDEKTYDLH